MEKLIHKSYSVFDGFAEWNWRCPSCKARLTRLYERVNVFDSGRSESNVYAYKCQACGWWGVDSNYEDGDLGGVQGRHIIGELAQYNVGDVITPTDALVLHLHKYPDAIYEIHPHKLEDIVGGIFKEILYCKVEFSKRTRDGGKDLVCFSADRGKFYVEVKRHRGRIGVSVVQRFVGVLYQNGISSGIIVTASSYSKDAIYATDMVNKQEHRLINLELKDYNDIISWLELYASKLDSNQIIDISRSASFRGSFLPRQLILELIR